MDYVQAFTQEARKFFHVRRTKFRKQARTNIEASWHRKWRMLGSGFYGEAWAHEDYEDLVIKISGPAGWGYSYMGAVQSAMHDDESEPRDDVWPDYAEFCMANPHPSLLRVHHIERVSMMAWAVLPRYEPNYGGMDRDALQIREALYGQRQAEYWMLPLLSIARGRNVSIDLHSENVMRDPETGNCVITDPFSTTGYGYGATQCSDFDDEYLTEDLTDDEEDEDAD